MSVDLKQLHLDATRMADWILSQDSFDASGGDVMREWLLGLLQRHGYPADSPASTDSMTLAAIKRHVSEWMEKRGHDQCWYYPEIFNAISGLLGVPVWPKVLPSEAEFRRGCDRYACELYADSEPTTAVPMRLLRAVVEKFTAATKSCAWCKECVCDVDACTCELGELRRLLEAQ